MVISSVEFVKSSATVAQCPQQRLPEYAFIGRSNVGKSSLINYLLMRKDLAKTSQKPGKTRLINHYLVNEQWYMVDLPGYGYASVNKQMRQEIEQIIQTYTEQREQLTSLFVLVDCRHEPQAIDLAFINKMGMAGVPLSIVFTKADKISKTALRESVARYQEKLLEEWEELPPIFVTSSAKGEGRDEMLDYIDQVNQTLK